MSCCKGLVCIYSPILHQEITAPLVHATHHALTDPAHAAPGEAPPTGLAYQLMGAGELLALMEGQRGLVMVQLYAGWHDDLGAAPQPVNNPFVVTLLARAVAEGSGLVVTMSSISGGLWWEVVAARPSLLGVPCFLACLHCLACCLVGCLLADQS